MTENTIVLDADVKPLRLQLREATEELQMTRAKFGEMSTEAVKAAQKVAGIKDSINAANESAQLFDPGSRFQALTTAASTAAGGIIAVQGAMGLFGAESEEVEKALLKVQSAMALSQGLSQLADLGKVTDQLKTSFKGLSTSTAEKVAATNSDTGAVVANTAANKGQAAATNSSSLASRAAAISLKVLRGALISLGIPALILGLVALVQNFDKIKSVVLNFIPSLGQLADFFGNLVQGVTDFVGITSEANRELDKLTKTTPRSNEDITARINLLSAQGGKEKEIFELKKQLSENELNVLRATLKAKGKLSEEEAKQFRDLKNKQIVEQAAFKRKEKEDEEKESEKENQKNKVKSDKAKTDREKINAQKLVAEKILLDAQNSLKTEREQEAIAIEATFQEQSKKLKEAGIADDGTLADQRNRALKAIDDKFKAEEAQKEADFQKQVNDIRTQVRLEGIADENEKARESLLVDQENRRQSILMDEKTTQDQKRILLLELSVQEDQELKALQLTIDEAKAAEDLADLDKEIAKADASFQIQKDLLDKKDALLKEQFAKGLLDDKEFTVAIAANAEARKDIDKEEGDFKIKQAKEAADVLGKLSALAGKRTAAGKALGIAEALVNTSVGVTQALKQESTLPSPFDVVAKVANVATILASGLKAVKSITAVNVPGGGGATGGALPSISASAPSTSSGVPTLGTSPVTALGTMMQNQPPLKAFVVESEVTGTQRRVADIERRAGF